jgi:hypothetical protein
LVTDSTLFVQVYQNDISYGCQSFAIDATTVCEITECTFLCLNKIQLFLCYSLREQVFLGIAFATACLVLVLLIGFILYKIYCCHMDRFKVTSTVINYPISDKDIPLQTVTTANSFLFLILLLGCFSVSNAQCTTTAIAVTPINTCTAGLTSETCTMQINILDTLETVGSSGCGRILDSGGKLIGSFNMTYQSSAEFGFTTPSYYTSSWTPLTISNKHCPGAGKCSSSTNCPATPWNCTTLGITGTACQWPNSPTCQASCGCAGCGCIICSSACLFGTYSFLPSGPIYQVFTITSVALSPTVKFCITIGTTSNCQTLSLGQQPTTLLTNYTANVVGSFLSSTTIFNNFKLIVGNGVAYLAPAADAGNPVFNTVGDIQFTNPNSVVSPSTTAYVYPGQKIVASATQSSLVYSFPAAGLGSLVNFAANQLPFMYGGVYWSLNSQGMLVGLVINAPPVQVSFSTINPVTFTFLATVVCPQTNAVPALAGYYDSDIGFTITLPQLRSSCSPGAVTVSYSDNGGFSCYTNVLNLNMTYSPYVIYCTSTTRTISGSITIAGQDSSIVIPISGILTAPPLFTQQQINDIVTNSSLYPETSSFTTFWDSLSGTALVFAKYAVSICVGLVFIAIIVGIIVLIVYVIKNYVTWKSLQDLMRPQNSYNQVPMQVIE